MSPSPLRSGRDALTTSTAQAVHGTDDFHPAERFVNAIRSSHSMLTADEREETTHMRARAAAELQSIREGLLGRRWRRHPRTLYLIGFLKGTTDRLQIDNAVRN